MKKNVVPFPTQPGTTLDATLRQAIRDKRLIQFKYDDAMRIAEPHDYGRRKGSDTVLAYQRWKANEKSPGAKGWRWLETAKIERCVLLEETFTGTREEAAQEHHEWDVIYARVDHGSQGPGASQPARTASPKKRNRS